MSDYTKTTNFTAKDSLPSGNAGKIVKGSEIDTEFTNIQTAVATKLNTNNGALTGTTTFQTISDGSIAITAFVDEDNMSSDSATLVPTQQSVKAYVDAQVTAQDLDFQADSGGALSIDLDSETLTFTGGTGIDTSGSGNAVTFAIDSTVPTLDGSGNLGIGDDSPASRLTVSRLGSSWSGVAPFAGCAALIHPGGTGAGSGATLTIAGNASSTSSIHFSSDTDNDVGRINYLFASNAMSFFNNGLERMRLDSAGNLLVGGTSTPASSGENIVLFNGTVPTGSVTDGIVLYAEDVSSSSELKVRDEAGNVTTLSPHNFELIPEGPSEDMAWSYFSEKDGKRINVDMLKAIRVLEKLSGEQLVFEA